MLTIQKTRIASELRPIVVLKGIYFRHDLLVHDSDLNQAKWAAVQQLLPQVDPA
jgi:hypothetical protein